LEVAILLFPVERERWRGEDELNSSPVLGHEARPQYFFGSAEKHLAELRLICQKESFAIIIWVTVCWRAFCEKTDMAIVLCLRLHTSILNLPYSAQTSCFRISAITTHCFS